MKKIRTLLADDHSLVRFGLASLLKLHDDFDVVGGAGDGEEAIRMARELKPDVVIMDLVMPVLDGVEATRRIHAELPAVKILILTSFGTSNDVSRAMAAGATGALVKDIPNDKLISAIRDVAHGKTVLSPEIERTTLSTDVTKEFTERQMTVLGYLANGLTNKEIAALLGVSHSAVKQHLIAIFTKLGAANRSEAVAIALRKHLLKI